MYTFMSTCIFPYSILQSYSQKQAQWSWSIYIRIDCKSRRKDSYRHVTFIARHLPSGVMLEIRIFFIITMIYIVIILRYNEIPHGKEKEIKVATDK